MTPQIDLCFALQDMTPDEIYSDKKFSQELEIALNSIPRWRPSETSYHKCSSRIRELDSMHKAEKTARLEYYNKIKDIYKDRLPLWWDSWLSWGNHFHIFFNSSDEINSMYSSGKYIVSDMYNFIQAVPLYAKFKKFDDGTKKFFSRRNWWHGVNKEITQSKSYWISAKRSYASSENRLNWRTWENANDSLESSVQSIEFRMNGTIDNRIYWLYQASMLYALDKTFWEVKKLSCSKKIYDGITETFQEEETDAYWCLTLDSLHERGLGFAITELDKKKLVNNINIMLQLLNKYGLVNSANSLQSYIDEYNILT